MHPKTLSTVFKSFASVALIVTLVGPAPSPASANGVGPSLPIAGDHLFAMASNGVGKRFGSIDVTTGAAIGLATNRESGDGLTGAAYDPTTGTAYVINEISNHVLQSMDPVTGALTTIATMWLGEPSAYKYVRSIAIADDGAAYAIVDNNVLYSLDLATAELTLIGNTGLGDLASLAVNPIDGLLYAVDGTNGVFTLNTTTGTPNRVGDNSAGMCGFQIDRAGVAWYYVCLGDLFSATDLTDIAGSSQDHGVVMIDGVTPRIWAILYVPNYLEPAPEGPSGEPLAKTGGSSASGIVLAGFCLVAAGAVVARRRRAL